MIQYDAIIIGGGLGGLVAGAKLAKEGKKVLLIEQHYIPGGCATTFKRRDYVLEVGLHEMDGLHDKDPKIIVFNDLDVFKHVEFAKAPEFYRAKKGNTDFIMPDDINQAIAALLERYPAEEKGIKRYFEVIQGIQDETRRYSLVSPQKRKWIMPIFPLLFPYLSAITLKKSVKYYPFYAILNPKKLFADFSNAGAFLDSIIQNDELKLLLLGNLAYYHDDPYSTSLLYFASGQASYYCGGGHFVKGGSQNLSNYFASIITKNNGTVLLEKKATRILTKNKKAIDIEFQSSFDKASLKQTAFADIIIANAAIPNVIDLLPVEDRGKLIQATKNLEPSLSLLAIYIGFKRNLKEI